MDTIKTAVVVALLLAVLYCVYTVLNKEMVPPPAEVTALMEQEELLAPPEIDFGITAPDTAVSHADPAQSTGAPSSSVYVEVEPLPRNSDAVTTATAPSEGAEPSNNPRVQVHVEPLRNETASSAYGSDTPTSSYGNEVDVQGTASRSADVPSDVYSSAEAPNSSYSSAEAPSGPYGGSDAQGSSYAGVSGPVEPAVETPSEQVPATDYADDSSSELPSNVATSEGSTDGYELPPIGGSPEDSTSIYSRQASNQPADQASESSSAGSAEATGEAPYNGASLAPTRFADVKQRAEAQIREGDFRGALETLSTIYGEPTLTADERQMLLAMLDPLAGKVIYSREHLLEPPYIVQRGETLMQIAQKHRVPWQLLRNINSDRVNNPEVLLPGTELKVVTGPFRAEVNLTEAELTLFLDQLYAGRFPITVGNEPSPAPGDYAIQDKQEGRTYYARDGRTLSAGDPGNPYGDVWLDLGVNNLSIHGSPERDSDLSGAGCIGLSPIDARDVHAILSQGSRVTIYR